MSPKRLQHTGARAQMTREDISRIQSSQACSHSLRLSLASLWSCDLCCSLILSPPAHVGLLALR